MTTDEWSSIRRHRYFNVNLHEKDSRQKNDEISSSNDGAAVMVKFCRIIPTITQLCLNHGIHLGVTKTLYKRRDDQLQDEFDDHESEEAVSEDKFGEDN